MSKNANNRNTPVVKVKIQNKSEDKTAFCETNPGFAIKYLLNLYNPKTAIVVSYIGKHGKMKVNGCNIVFTDIKGLQKLLT